MQRILWSTRQALSPRGRLQVYQFSDAIEPVLKRYFRLLHSRREMRNFYPRAPALPAMRESGIRYPTRLQLPGRITASERCGLLRHQKQLQCTEVPLLPVIPEVKFTSVDATAARNGFHLLLP